MSKNQKITPRGNKEESSGQEQSGKKPEDYSKRKQRGNKRVGAKCQKIRRLLQEETKRNQASRSKVAKNQKAAPRVSWWEASG